MGIKKMKMCALQNLKHIAFFLLSAVFFVACSEENDITALKMNDEIAKKIDGFVFVSANGKSTFL